MMRPRAMYGHCIWLNEHDRRRMAETQSAAAICPTSNLFLGSGLFGLKRLTRRDKPVRVSVATDIGGGTSYSMLRTMSEAYKVLQLQGQSLSAFAALHAITLGNRDRRCPAVGYFGGVHGLERIGAAVVLTYLRSLVGLRQVQRQQQATGEPWSRVARHMLGLRHGQPGSRKWRQVWSDHRLKARPAAEVMALARADLR